MDNEKLNILFDATVLVDGLVDYHARTGIYFVAQNLLDEMALREDINVYLVAYPSKIAGLYKIKPDSATILDKNTWHSKLIFFLGSLIKRIKRKVFSFSLIRKNFSLMELILEKGYETFYSHFIFNQHFCSKELNNSVYFSPSMDAPKYISRKRKIKRFIVIHDAIPFKLKEYKNQRNNKWVCYFLNNQNYYFSVSDSTKKDFYSIYPSIDKCRIQTTRLAAKKIFSPKTDQLLANSVKSKYGIPLEKKYVFSLCTLEPRKNLIRAVKCFILFAEKNAVGNMIFALGGASWHDFENRLKNDPDICKLYSKYVTWIGYVADDDLPILYSNAEWFVYTSQYEGFGLPPLEAMQCGCPVIVSNNSSLPEVVGDAGIMIDWDSDDQHIEAYEKYFYNENLRNEHRHKGLEQAKRFSWESTVNKMVNIMKSQQDLGNED